VIGRLLVHTSKYIIHLLASRRSRLALLWILRDELLLLSMLSSTLTIAIMHRRRCSSLLGRAWRAPDPVPHKNTFSSMRVRAGASTLLLFGVLHVVIVGVSTPRAFAFLQQPHHQSSPWPRRYLSSFGLTDDGDFFIEGINERSGGDNSDTVALPNYLSTLSLGSADSISENSSEPAGGVAESRRTPMSAQRDVGDFVGLNDAGDFLMVGINGDDPLEISPREEEEQSMPSFGLKLTSADDSIDMAAIQRFREQSEVSRIKEDTREEDNLSAANDDDEVIGSIGEWLSELIPTLRDTDNVKYARELVDIGFDPGCVTQCELTWDDLSFMKLLHRRYLYNEITGQDHPWEA
jgi:hypothetical protein